MKTTKLPLAKWQELLDAYKADPATPYEEAPCFRVDGTQFSVGIFYGGFDYNGKSYTVVDPAEDGAYLACSPAFLAWVRKRKRAGTKSTVHQPVEQLRLALEGGNQ